jgi:hypothetical protein
MTGLLVVGFTANLLVRPVASAYWMKDQTLHLQVEHTEHPQTV